MKFIINILLCFGCCSAFLFSKEVDGNKKSLKCDPAIAMGTLKLSHGYGEMTAGDDVIERKRSHKRRRVVRKPRKGRSK